MNATVITPDLPELEPPRSFYTHKLGLWSWFVTTDHKRIAILYAVTITIFFIMGGVAAAMMRINLVEPNGALLSAETYNTTFTFHGVVMVWFFLIPSIPATL
ncbi:MAG TPA: cbb3-type cytochrome c oxidase subunit I, partial [Rhodanobacteraceae bacterium]|nr:cbb3-type cytochrome c oxidase subunit I [Rhodanobacteraceae bacterium]